MLCFLCEVSIRRWQLALCFGCLLKKGTNIFSLAIRRTAKAKFASKTVIQELAQTDMDNSIPVASFYEWSH